MAPSRLRAVEDQDLVPVCPHCEAELGELSTRELESASDRARARFGVRYVYACPSCRAVLGVSHRKGFWMG